jgi:hypothetical protein
MKLKFAFLILGLGLFSMMAFSPKQDKQVTLQLSVQEVEYVLGALQEKPMKEVSGLVTKIYTQAQKQLSDTTKKK